MYLLAYLLDLKAKRKTNLDKKVNSNDLIYRYKGNDADAKFDEFDYALSLLDKIRDDKTKEKCY